jgi:predicted nucleotidyltransferase
LGDLKVRLGDAFGARLRELRLFGSVARGEAGPDSDVDVLVLLDEVRSSRERIAAMEIVVEVALERELLLEPLILGEDELERLRRLETALARALDHEGIRL